MPFVVSGCLGKPGWRARGHEAMDHGMDGRVAPVVHGGLYLMLGVGIAPGYLDRWSGERPAMACGAVICSPFGPMS